MISDFAATEMMEIEMTQEHFSDAAINMMLLPFR